MIGTIANWIADLGLKKPSEAEIQMHIRGADFSIDIKKLYAKWPYLNRISENGFITKAEGFLLAHYQRQGSVEGIAKYFGAFHWEVANVGNEWGRDLTIDKLKLKPTN